MSKDKKRIALNMRVTEDWVADRTAYRNKFMPDKTMSDYIRQVVALGESILDGTIKEEDEAPDAPAAFNREQIISAIIKAIKTEENLNYIAEVYYEVVGCGECPFWHDCKNEHECNVYILDKLMADEEGK